MDVDRVEGISTERSDKKQCLSFLKVNSSDDGVKEVSIDELFPGIPDVAALFINDGILVRMVVVGSEARRGSKEVGEGNKVGGKGGEEADRSRWGRGSDDSNGCFNDGRRGVLNWDILVGDMVNNFTGKLELHPIFLIKWQKEDVKFFLGDTNDVGSCFFTELFEVKLSRSTKGFKGGLWGRQGWGLDNIGAGVNGVGLEGV